MTDTPKRIAHAVLAFALLVVAALLWQTLPDKLQSSAPLRVDGSVGERVAGRNLAVTVHEVHLAREVTFTSRGTETALPGVWLVSVLTYESLLEPAKPGFELDASGSRYTTNLGGLDAAEKQQPGLPVRTVVAFELPEIPDKATLLVANKVPDKYGVYLNTPLDSQLAIALTWDQNGPERSVDLDRLGR